MPIFSRDAVCQRMAIAISLQSTLVNSPILHLRASKWS